MRIGHTQTLMTAISHGRTRVWLVLAHRWSIPARVRRRNCWVFVRLGLNHFRNMKVTGMSPLINRHIDENSYCA